jgi:hypothetical protein
MSWWLMVLAMGAAGYYALGMARRSISSWGMSPASLGDRGAGPALVLGRAAYYPRGAERLLEIGLFAEDTCMRLGMFGTVAGCLIRFGADISSFDAGDAPKTAALI